MNITANCPPLIPPISKSPQYGNVTAIATAANFGIAEEFAVKYHADKEGTRLNYESVSDVVSSYRNGAKINKSWKKGIESDYASRKQHRK